MHKNILSLLIPVFPLLLSAPLSAQEKTGARETPPLASRIAELDDKIQDQKILNASLVLKQKTAVADSAAAEAGADKKITEAAKAIKDLSAALEEKHNGEPGDLRDSLSRPDKEITRVKHQMDSINAKSGTLKKDSAAAWGKNSKAIKAAAQQLRETRQAIVSNDSLVKFRTAELYRLRDDSSGTLSSLLKKDQVREREAQRLDSLARALQTVKITLIGMQEKMQQDSIILALTRELREMRNAGGASADSLEEKQQMIETFTMKRTRLLRDHALAAMVAAEAKTSREALKMKISTKLAAIDRSLDSVAAAREKNSREHVLQEKEYSEKSRGILKRMDSLSKLISRISGEGADLKTTQLSKRRKDSADAVYRRDSANLAYGIKLEPFTEGVAGKTGEHETLKRKQDQTDKRIQDREKEEMTVKEGRHAQLLARIKQARADSANAVREKKQQQTGFQKTLAELNNKIAKGKQNIKELEAQRAALQKQAAGKGKK